MKSIDKVRLGYCPSRRTMFSKSEAQRYRNMIKEVISSRNVEIIDIDGINDEELLFDGSDVSAIVERFSKAHVDAVFFPLCNFGEESLVGEVAKALMKPVLLYGPRDEGPDENGMRLRDSQCGLFAAGKVLRRFNVSFTYLTNSDPHSEYFSKGFDRFLRVVQVVKAVSNMRILQIGTRPTPFMSVIANEGELLERFGIRVIPIDVSTLSSKAEFFYNEDGEKFKDTTNRIISEFLIDHDDPLEAAKRLASLKMAMDYFRVLYNVDCCAIQCWDALQALMHLYPCAINGILADEGFPVACETDIHGAISAFMLQAATGHAQSVLFADLTIRHPEDDNVELLWHCGPFPPSMAKPDAVKRVTDFWTGESTDTGDMAFPIREGKITVCRFDGDHGEYQLFIGEGEVVPGPHSVGTYAWMRVEDWPMWEHRLVRGPYIHHIAGTYGECAEVLAEACRFIPGLTPDACQPTQPQLERRWR